MTFVFLTQMGHIPYASLTASTQFKRARYTAAFDFFVWISHPARPNITLRTYHKWERFIKTHPH